MVIVKLQGGLGNQLFQYAFARALSKYLKTYFLLDISFLEKTNSNSAFRYFYPNFSPRTYQLGMFDVEIPTTYCKQPIYTSINPAVMWIRKKMSHITGLPSYYAEPNLGFDNTVFQKIKNNSYIEGYWQNEAYFGDIAQELRNELRKFSTPIAKFAEDLLSQIRASESVCVHIRMDDFLFTENTQFDYYQKQIKQLEKQLTDPIYFVFSDDIDWCKKQNFEGVKTIFVSNNQHLSLRNEFELMTNCKHHIIGNSTLGRWAEWISKG